MARLVVVRRRATRAPGPVESSVMVAAARFALLGRTVVVLGCTALLPLGAPRAGSVWLVAAVLAWQAGLAGLVAGLVAAGAGRRLRWWGPFVAAVDGLVVGVLCVALPLGHLQHGDLDLEAWLRPVNSVVIGAAQWYTRPRTGALIVVVVAAAVLAGSASATGGWYLSAEDAFTLLWQGVLSRCLVVLVARGAGRVDDLTETVARERRSAHLAAARRRDVEGHLTLVHDTVAATLTAAAFRGAGGATLLEAARADLTQLALQPHPDAGAGTGPGPGPETGAAPDLTTTPGPDGGDSLQVTTVLVGLDGDRARWAEALGAVPADAVRALAAARDEALRNVQRHAATDRARVELRLPAVGAVELVVVDDGRGFEPGPGHRHGHFGVRLSIEARMDRAGGQARVYSAPGRGTRVELRWPREGGG